MSNFTDLPANIIDLDHLSEKVDDPQVGQHVVIYSRGNYREAVVTKVGAKRVTVEYTTPSAIVVALKLALLSREEALRSQIDFFLEQAEAYEDQARVIERLGIRPTEDDPNNFVPVSSLPAEYVRLDAGRSTTTIVRKPETLREWAANARENAERRKALLPEAQEYDAQPLEVKAEALVNKTTKAVARDQVYALPEGARA